MFIKKGESNLLLSGFLCFLYYQVKITCCFFLLGLNRKDYAFFYPVWHLPELKLFTSYRKETAYLVRRFFENTTIKTSRT